MEIKVSPVFTSHFIGGDNQMSHKSSWWMCTHHCEWWVCNWAHGCSSMSQSCVSLFQSTPGRRSSFPFTWILPLSLCFCPFRTKFPFCHFATKLCPEIPQRLKLVGAWYAALHEAKWNLCTELFTWWPVVFKALLITWKALYDLVPGSLTYSSEVITTEVSWGFDPHHAVKGRCSLQGPWMSSVPGCEIAGCCWPGHGIQDSSAKGIGSGEGPVPYGLGGQKSSFCGFLAGQI